MTVTELGDADGHIIEPGNLWAERMPKELRDMAPRWFRDEQGVFHQEIYGLDISTLEVMQGGMRPRDMLQNMGLAAAMGQDLAGGTFQPHVSAAACTVYNDWLMDEYCAGSGGRLIPVAALPIIDVDASVAEVKRCAERGYQAVFIRKKSSHGTKSYEPKFDAVWQEITDTGLKL